MAARLSIPLVVSLFLVTFVAQAHAQFGPSVSGGNAMRRTDVPSSAPARLWQFRERLGSTAWTAPLWLTSRMPVGGFFVQHAARLERRDGLRSRLP